MADHGYRERIAIFVDAGYLFKQGGLAVSGRKPARTEITFDPAAFCSMLHDWVEARVPGGVRRTYWYDGARSGILGPDHVAVAALPFVKLRMGRVNGLGQRRG